MLEQILDYERNMFLWLNGGHSAFGNQFMWLFSGIIFWIPVALVFIFLLCYKNKKNWKEVLLILLAITLTITLCDQFSSGFCKPFFSRFRPTHHVKFMNEVQTVFDYRGGKYGFISSHAANAFGFATITALIFRYKLYAFFIYIWATINAYSRIYLGVHFISDIIAGTIAGIFFGWLVYRIYIFSYNKMIYNKLTFLKIAPTYSTNNRKNLKIVLYTLSLTIVIMISISILYSTNLIHAITIK